MNENELEKITAKLIKANLECLSDENNPNYIWKINKDNLKEYLYTIWCIVPAMLMNEVTGGGEKSVLEVNQMSNSLIFQAITSLSDSEK